MPARVYTERLLSKTGDDGGTSAVMVPAGYRAIVTSFAVRTDSTAGGWVFLGVQGIFPLRVTLQDQTQSQVINLRLVAYAGESITALSDGPQTSYTVTGYVFEDDGRSAGIIKPTPPELIVPPTLDPRELLER